jgi:2'-5' RNA ligase
MAASWVESANYHVTLRVLGDIDPLMTVELRALAARAGAECAPFSLSLQTMGAFPTLERARVLWIGGETPAAFRGLATAIERDLGKLGFPAEPKPPVAHVTIARLKGLPDRRLGEILERMGAVPAREFQPTSVVLMQSELGPQGARYTPLFSVPIAHADA